MDQKTIVDDTAAQVWIDSDDERIVVSLASESRLRKLRLTESEDLVNGKEYAKRLRQQFERLYPIPEWANPPLRRKSVHKSRRRLSHSSMSTEDDRSASEMSLESEELSVQPLAKLLRNTKSLVEATTMKSSSRTKLRPEILDIQRTKDVGSAQPVSYRCARSSTIRELPLNIHSPP